MKSAAYVRVSTGKQDLDVQLQELREFATRKGWQLVAVYSDVASGAKEDRLEFRKLMADVARGRFGAVVVQRFDRAARSVRQLVETLEHLRRCRTAFVSIKEEIDTTTPAGELIFHVMAALAQLERALYHCQTCMIEFDLIAESSLKCEECQGPLAKGSLDEIWDDDDDE